MSFEKIDPSKFIVEGAELRIKRAIEGLSSDPAFSAKLAALGLTAEEVRDNLPILLDWQQNSAECASTEESGGPEFEMEVVRDGGRLEARYSPRKRDMERMRIESRYLLRQFPANWVGAGIRDVRKAPGRNQALLRLVKSLQGAGSPSIYLVGEPGSGRSFLLASFANTYALMGKGTVAFCDTPSTIDGLRRDSIEDKASFERGIGWLKVASVLILDAFGSEYKSDYTLSSIILPVLGHRLREGLPTAFASDFSLAEVAEMYSRRAGTARGKQLEKTVAAITGQEVYYGAR